MAGMELSHPEPARIPGAALPPVAGWLAAAWGPLSYCSQLQPRMHRYSILSTVFRGLNKTFSIISKNNNAYERQSFAPCLTIERQKGHQWKRLF